MWCSCASLPHCQSVYLMLQLSNERLEVHSNGIFRPSGLAGLLTSMCCSSHA